MKQHICNCVISCSCFKNRKAAFAYLNLCSRSLELLSPGWNLKVLRECTFEDNAWGWGAPLLVWNLSANHSRWCWFWWPLRIFPQCLWQIIRFIVPPPQLSDEWFRWTELENWFWWLRSTMFGRTFGCRMGCDKLTAFRWYWRQASWHREACRYYTWLILPVVICLSQRLSHACLSISIHLAKLQMAH